MSPIQPAQATSVLNETAIAAPAFQSYQERPARPEAADLVSCIWVQQVSAAGPSYEHRTVPNGCVEIAHERGSNAVRVAGPRQDPAVERLPPGGCVVGVRLRPGTVPALLGHSAVELAGREVDLDQLWGRSALTLAERLAEAATPDDAARLLENELVDRAAAAREPDPLVAEAIRRLQPWQADTVTTVTSELFISARQMRRRFAAALGCSPKTLQRILRFQGFLALTDSHTGTVLPLAWLARTAGYADQAHLTRECRRLAGLTPSAFLDEIRQNCKPNHNHAASFASLRYALTSQPG